MRLDHELSGRVRLGRDSGGVADCLSPAPVVSPIKLSGGLHKIDPGWIGTLLDWDLRLAILLMD